MPIDTASDEPWPAQRIVVASQSAIKLGLILSDTKPQLMPALIENHKIYFQLQNIVTKLGFVMGAMNQRSNPRRSIDGKNGVVETLGIYSRSDIYNFLHSLGFKDHDEIRVRSIDQVVNDSPALQPAITLLRQQYELSEELRAMIAEREERQSPFPSP